MSYRRVFIYILNKISQKIIFQLKYYLYLCKIFKMKNYEKLYLFHMFCPYDNNTKYDILSWNTIMLTRYHILGLTFTFKIKYP